MLAITAQRATRRGDYTGSEQVPTFYLDENVQGIVSEDHAKRIAADIIGPDVVMDSITVARCIR